MEPPVQVQAMEPQNPPTTHPNLPITHPNLHIMLPAQDMAPDLMKTSVEYILEQNILTHLPVICSRLDLKLTGKVVVMDIIMELNMVNIMEITMEVSTMDNMEIMDTMKTIIKAVLKVSGLADVKNAIVFPLLNVPTRQSCQAVDSRIILL
jgi:hypothetical protein